VALYGVAHVLHLNLREPDELRLARNSLKGFMRSSPESQRDPLPWEAYVLISAWPARQGGTVNVLAARLLVVLYDGSLRPSEGLAIRGCDVHVRPRDSGHYLPLAIKIAPFVADTGLPPAPRTKAGEYDDTVVFGEQPSLMAGRGVAMAVLRLLKATVLGIRRLFPITLAQLDVAFAAAVDALGLCALRVSPHCCRHGGPSTNLRKLRTLDEAQRRERCKVLASVRRYEKAGRLLHQLALVTPALLRQAKFDAARPEALLAPQQSSGPRTGVR